MNETGICWADTTWNPIVGCDGPADEEGQTRRCEYCYAHGLRGRIGASLKCEDCATFTPHLHPERLVGERAPAAVRKPQIVFCDSMGDWWGPRVDPEWRLQAYLAMMDAPQHHYVLLTKRADLICEDELHDHAPSGLWLGVSMEGTDEASRDRLEHLLYIADELPSTVRPIVSIEPLIHGWDWHLLAMPKLRWVIVGRQTGPGADPKLPTGEDLDEVAKFARRSGAALWEKTNLGLGAPVQERPGEMGG